MNTAELADWSGPGVREPRRQRRTWNRILWSLIYPQRGQRIIPTVSGVLLTVLAMGVGTAAYNSANNILFITLSLMLACLILSGVLSWLNFSGVRWRLQTAPPWRAGQTSLVTVELGNHKTFLPTYGLWFELAARRVDQRPAVVSSTLTGKGVDVRASLARAKQNETTTKIFLRTRLDPRGEGRVEWPFLPLRRGRWRIELQGVGSLFPFGFLSKSLGTDVAQEVTVWPAPVEYRRHTAAGSRRETGGEHLARAGSGSDLLALRRYAAGDSHRLIHWKASARTGQLLVRQFTTETSEGYSLWLQTEAARWPRPEQFELALSLAATLAEDLFRRGQLMRVVVDHDPPLAVRSVHDLEAFLERLALVEGDPPAGPDRPASPFSGSAAPAAARTQRNLMTFVPDGARGVIAYVDGEKAASA
ncbi:MAG: DUF58 domain-containing protein [Opitutaceae bacterium]|nr:DUF58 domain-containing protein [Opitutaceae bacterium]MBP9914128.1 DUF58 domain-containing protein [Opitutaceae bacterium]